jgi:hypothetical protein
MIAATCVALALSLVATDDAAGRGPRPAISSSSHGALRHNTCPRSAIDVPRCGVLWGLYTPLTPTSRDMTAPYPSIERRIGRRFDLVRRYEDWARGDLFPGPVDRRLAAHGRILDFSWHAISYHTRREISWRSIARGIWDKSVILPEARRLKHWHHRVFIDFESEFDNATTADRGTPAEYVAAYRHVYRVFESAGVHNVIWAWVSTGDLAHESFIRRAWPGKHFVDWVGYDPYNFYRCHSDRNWKPPRETFVRYYGWLQAQPPMRNKPVLLAEYGTAPGPRIKAWYAGIARALAHLPRIKALIQWSSHTSPTCEFRLTSSPAAMSGFAKASVAPNVLG